MRIKLIFIALLFSFSLSQVKAGDFFKNIIKLNTTYNRGHDSIREKFVELQTDRLAIRPMLVNKLSSVLVYSPNLNKGFRYNPNENINLGLAGFYKWIGLGLSFKLPFINNDDAEKGQTLQLDLQANLFALKYGTDFWANYYRGFYLSEFGQGLNEDPNKTRYIRPDIKMMNIGANTYYVFNYKKYANRAPYINMEIQKKSAASFLLMGTLSFFKVSGDSSIIPGFMYPDFSNVRPFNSAAHYQLGVSPGFGGTLAKNGFYANMMIFGGPMLQVQDRYWSDGEQHVDLGFGLRVQNRMALGYANAKYFFALTWFAEVFHTPNPEYQIQGIMNTIRLFGGFRL